MTYSKPVMKMRITPIFRRLGSCNRMTPDMGSRRIQKSVTRLKYPTAKIVSRIPERPGWRREANFSAKETPGGGVDRTKRTIVVVI